MMSVAVAENTIVTEIHYDGIKGKILQMLGNGLSNDIVATAAGVSVSYISQLLSEESFAMQVTQKRFDNLQANTIRDNQYDDIEDKLIEKMRDLLPMMYRPMEVLRAIQVINAAKRRGASAPEQVTINNTVINLNIPRHQMQRFTKSIDGQVVQAGDQTLVTMSSNNLLSTIATQNAIITTNKELLENSNDNRSLNPAATAATNASKDFRTEVSREVTINL